MTYIKNIATLEYKRELCTGCGMCKTVCPHGVFALQDGKAEILDRDNCMECGACMVNCPEEALTVNKGVGCAYAVISSKLKGSKEISCDCGGNEETADKEKSCCC
jgi:NAD-dependent dihydropyrimidine dehydrogenase PreA subunit